MGYRDERETSSGTATFIVILLIALFAGGGLLTVILGGLFLFSVRQSHTTAEIRAAEVARMTLEDVYTAEKANLPARMTIAVEDATAPSPAIEIELNATGETKVGGEKLTAAELDEFVARIHRDTPEQAFEIRADENASFEAVTTLFAAIKRAGVTKIQLTTEDQP